MTLLYNVEKTNNVIHSKKKRKKHCRAKVAHVTFDDKYNIVYEKREETAIKGETQSSYDM
jgi:hypothetical protein